MIEKIWEFLKKHKLFFLLPILIVFLIFGIMFIFCKSPGSGPFVYASY
jgi:competence protein ComGC